MRLRALVRPDAAIGAAAEDSTLADEIENLRRRLEVEIEEDAEPARS